MRLSDCQDEDVETMPMEQEQTSVVKLFRKKNPTVDRFEVV